jgi:hypothetical protein
MEVTGSFEDDNEHRGAKNCGEISWLAEKFNF